MPAFRDILAGYNFCLKIKGICFILVFTIMRLNTIHQAVFTLEKDIFRCLENSTYIIYQNNRPTRKITNRYNLLVVIIFNSAYL